LRVTSHTLKGSSIYFSVKLHKLAEALEEAAQKESRLDCVELMKALDAQITQLLWELERIFHRIRPAHQGWSRRPASE
jgi:hypothetical protein